MNKKGYYVAYVNDKNKDIALSSGVYKKIKNQCKVLNKHYNVELDTYYKDNNKDNNMWEKIRKRLPLTYINYKWKYNGQYDDADFLYIRRVIHDRSFIRFLKKIKKRNKDVKILYEIPTFPYDYEMKGVKNIPFKLKDKWYRNKLSKYVDKIIITADNADEVFGIDTINIPNGINFNNIRLSNYDIKDEEINLIEVAVPSFWHGYDRILKGIGEYYCNNGKRNIILHMVGDGVSIPLYKRIIKDYGIENHVILYGNKYGKDLDKIYDKCSIGIDHLGGHRKKINKISSLKSREYFAKGLPIVTSVNIDFIPSDYKYQLMLPSNDEPIDINKIINFHDEIFLKNNYYNIKEEIRNFAKANCSIEQTMKPIINYLLKH